MNAGDLIEWAGERWFVRKVERQTNSAILLSAKGQPEVLPLDFNETHADTCRVVCSPMVNWPFLVAPARVPLGRLRSVVHEMRTLTPFVDWVKPEEFQLGGTIYFNPDLGLRFGSVLVTHHERGTSRLSIPINFGTLEQRVAPVVESLPVAPEARRSAYDRLLNDDDEYDD